MEIHELIIQKILDSEWNMFRNVRSAVPASCQNSPDTFRKIRASIYDCWTEEMLESYLTDLKLAEEKGRNLITEKYARMDNLIPPLSHHPMIEKIVEIEARWQLEIKKNYPALYNQTCRGTDPTGDGSNFSIYLRSELETYGDNTIELYYKNVKKADERKENLALLMLERLVKQSGYNDAAHAERILSSRR